MHNFSFSSKAKSGNVLFLILIAVALFAALSYVVTSSTRGQGDASREQVRLGVSEIQNFFASVHAALHILTVLEGLQIEEIDFRYDTESNDGTPRPSYINNPNCNADGCEIFNPLGGRVIIPDFSKIAKPADASESSLLKNGAVLVTRLNIPNVGTSKNDILIRIKGLKLEICAEYNRRNGIAGTEIISSTAVANDPSIWDVLAATAPSSLAGQRTFAFVGAADADTCGIASVIFER